MAQVTGSIDGIFFENQYLTATGLGAFGNGCLSDGILTGCGITINGDTVTIGEGFIVVRGRVFYVSETTISTIETGYSYYGIIATVDTTGLSSEESFEQVTISLTHNDSISGLLGDITTSDINLTGTTASTLIAVLENTGTLSVVPGSIHYATARSMAKLWENGNKTAEFSSSSIVLPALCFYDAMLVHVFVRGGSYNYHKTYICPYEAGNDVTYSYNMAESYIGKGNENWGWLLADREVTVNGATGLLTFSDAWYIYSGHGTANNLMVPYEIYGMSMH